MLKIAEKDANKVAQQLDYKDAHQAKNKLGGSRVNLYRDKKTGKIYVWDGKATTEPLQL